MRIVTEGNSPEEYRFLCYMCNTIFAYDYRDCLSNNRKVLDDEYTLISCPFCRTELLVPTICW